MGAEWMPGADRDPRTWACYKMARNTSSRRVVLHWTGSPKTASPKSQADYMHKGNGNTGYHLLVPMTDRYRPLQLRPASCGAGSLLNTGDLKTSPNKQGTVLIQVAIVCTTGDDPFTRGPGPWWPAVLDWLDGWGVPRQFVSGDWNANAVMSTSAWYSANSGYTAHKQVPETPGKVRKPDPGPVTPAVLWGDAGGSPPPSPPPGGGASTFTLQMGAGTMSLRMMKETAPRMKGEDVRHWQSALADGGYNPGTVDGVWGPDSTAATRRAQAKHGLTQDGLLGARTAQALIEKG